MRMILKRMILLSPLAVLLAAACQTTQPLPERVLPKPDTLVTDQVGILSPEEVSNLTNDLRALEKDKLAQAVIYIVPALPAGEGMEELTLRSVNSWGLGRRRVNDGLAIFVFKADRKIRIELGSGLEAAISSAEAKAVIDEELAPEFRKNNYAEGLRRAVARLRQLLIEHRSTLIRRE